MEIKFMSSGLCRPYAVVNGEDRMVEHIEQGVRDLEENDRLFVFTDGFEHYFENVEFTDFFKNWTPNIQKQISEYSIKMNFRDPEKYGHERSLIAILHG